MRPLDGSRLKIIRAQEHLNSLKLEVSRYLQSHPYEFAAENNRNKITVKHAVIKSSPPLFLSCILGDCLANVRTSLDYIAWQLAVKYSRPSPVVGRNRLYFPLANSTASFNNNCLPDLMRYYFPTPVIDIIKKVQPYRAGYEPLRILQRLGNEDKHCLPLLTVAYAETALIEIVSKTPIHELTIHPNGGRIYFIRDNPVNKIVVSKDDPIESEINIGLLHLRPQNFETCSVTIGFGGNARGKRASKNASKNVNVNGQVTIFVSIKNPSVPLEPADRTLEQIIECVANIIPRFDPYL